MLCSTQLPIHQRMNANGNGYQMTYFPETIIQWNTVPAVVILYNCCTMHNNTYSAHNHLIEVVASLSPALVSMLLRLLSSAVWSQLPAISPFWRAGPPGFQDGSPFPRIHAHSPLIVRYKHPATYLEALHLHFQSSCQLKVFNPFILKIKMFSDLA